MTIENTSKTGVRPEWLLGGAPEAIEAQEAEGQQQLCNSQQLPAKVFGDISKLPFEMGEPSEGDPLFCDVVLPDGWKIEPTDHSMWSKLVDDQGVERAAIFYKAAFYDRTAHMTVSDASN